MRLDVRLGCDLANVSAGAADAFKASADRVFAAALERVKELAVAYAEGAESARPLRLAMRAAGRHSLGARAARAPSDAAAGDASVLIVAEAERAEAERLVGAHCASLRDQDPLARVLVAGRLAQPVIVPSGVEAGDLFATYGRARRRR